MKSGKKGKKNSGGKLYPKPEPIKEERIEEKPPEAEKLPETEGLPEERQPEAEEPVEKELTEERSGREKERKEVPVLLRMAGTLCALCVICALVLGLVDLLTADRIAENQGARNDSALAEVLPYGESYTKVNYTGGDPTVEIVYEAEGTGYAVQVSPTDSFSGTLTVLVGVNADGTVAGVAVVDSQETENLGDRAKEPAWREQFVGKSGLVQVEADGGSISAISGATITSRAVCAAVTAALNVAAELG